MASQAIPPGARADLRSAKTLTIVGMAFLGVFVALLVLFAVLLLSTPPPPPPTRGSGGALVLLVPLLFTGFGLVPLILLVLVYFYVYRRLALGRVSEAIAPAMALGVVSIILGGVIPGIPLLIGYVKARDAYAKILYAPAEHAPAM